MMSDKPETNTTALADMARIADAIRSGNLPAIEGNDDPQAEIESLRKLVYVPGQWRCPKCGFVLIQSNLNANDGSVTARDDPGERCPNDGTPLWRSSWRQDAMELGERLDAALTRIGKMSDTIGRLSAAGTTGPTVKIKRLPHGAGLPLPAYATDGDAGLDLSTACIDCGGDQLPAAGLDLYPGQRIMIGTGFAFEIPDGYVGQVCPRSGLAHRHGVTVLNAPGIIDSSYRGELGVLLINNGRSRFVIKRGDRIAQFVIAPVSRAAIEEVEKLGETVRGEAGFGSTGT